MSEPTSSTSDERVAALVRDLYLDARPPADGAERVMEAMRADRARRSRGFWARTYYRAPLAAAAVVLFLAGVVVDRMVHRAVRPGVAIATAVGGTLDSGREVTFVFTAPTAKDVALVGDFNEWNGQGSKLIRNAAGEWQIRLRMPAGLHMYAFVIDGSTWAVDPLAPRGAGNDYGLANSAILVGTPNRAAAAPRS
jgi:hypothetical protein